MSNFWGMCFALWAFWLFMPNTIQGEVQFEVYVTSGQVETLFGSEDKRVETMAAFQSLDIEKVYLETVRGGRKPPEKTLVDARDDLREHGFEVSGAVATTNGNDFGVPSNQPGIWLNYQAPKTGQDLAEHFRWVASLFDEIIIDDFFATDDTSDISVQAKGDRTWPEYRLELMHEFAKTNVIRPAREANPKVKLILKFPQWYDRFHKFGYDAARSHQLFDRIWVGTETRNPETKRFGFTMPTMGYINYSWLRSFNPKKIGGGWFDFGDCTPETYLMQAYQTVLAGADEIMLFEAGSVVSHNPCIEPFQARRHAVKALGAIIEGKTPKGIAAYKPPNSEGSDANGAANLYVYDYLASLGFPVVPVSAPPGDYDRIFLARQAADDPEIASQCKTWIKQGKVVFVTPDFLASVGDDELFRLAGYESAFVLSTKTKPVQSFLWYQNNRRFRQTKDVQETIDLRVLPMPGRFDFLAAGVNGDATLPVCIVQKHGDGTLIVLNIQTYAHEEFAPGKEQFLPPRPLSIRNWPGGTSSFLAVVQGIVRAANQPQIITENNSGTVLFDDTIVFSNFTSKPVEQAVVFHRNRTDPNTELRLHPDFPHLKESRIRKQDSSNGTIWYVDVPPWDLTVVSW